MKPLRPPGLHRTDSHLRPVLRPRPNLPRSSYRALGIVPVLLNAEDFSIVVNFGALSHGSVLAVYASGRRHRRLRNTHFRWVIGPFRSRFRGMGFFRLVSFTVSDKLLLSWVSLGAIQG
jgi:hypothetical protein